MIRVFQVFALLVLLVPDYKGAQKNQEIQKPLEIAFQDSLKKDLESGGFFKVERASVSLAQDSLKIVVKVWLSTKKDTLLAESILVNLTEDVAWDFFNAVPKKGKYPFSWNLQVDMYINNRPEYRYFTQGKYYTDPYLRFHWEKALN